MDVAPDVVRLVVSLAGGSLVGRTRLQKAFYLLETCDVGFGFEFDYHHYGPYSEELAEAARDAAALGLVRTEWLKSPFGADYAVYTVDDRAPACDERDRRRAEILTHVAACESVVVELAATAVFLRRAGHTDDAWGEVALRKAKKYNDERRSKASRLLEALSLEA